MVESAAACALGRASAAGVGKERTLNEQYGQHAVAGPVECPNPRCGQPNQRTARFCARCGGRLAALRASERGNSSYANQRLIWIAPSAVIVGLLVVLGFAVLGAGAVLLIPAAIVGMWAFGVRFRDVQHPTGESRHNARHAHSRSGSVGGDGTFVGDAGGHGNFRNYGNMGGQA